MENSNSREYLEKITAAVIDNLRHTAPVPSVQMQDVPRKPFGGMTDEEEAELDDLDEDENKDVRMTEHRWDKRVVHEAEFEASDDDEMARKNGATRNSSNKRTFTDYKKGGMEIDSGNASPVNGANGAPADEPASEETHDINDDTIEDISAQDHPERDTDQAEEISNESGKDNIDGDGDIGMEDSTAVEEPKEIKKEEVEPETAPEPAPTEKPTDDQDADKEPTLDTASKETESTPKSAETTEKDKPAEATVEATKGDPAPDAMEVDEDKEKPAEKKERSKSPEK